MKQSSVIESLETRTLLAFSAWSAIGPAIAKVPATAGQLASVSVINFGTTVYTGPLNVKATLDRIRANNGPNRTNDGGVYNNSNGLLPAGHGTWYEFTVDPKTGTDHNFSTVAFPGPMRIALATDGYTEFTGDHYSSWKLVYNPAAATPPTIGSFTISPSSVTVGTSATLSANNVTKTGGTISNVKFYRESNGTAGLQIGSDLLVGTGLQSGSNWTISAPTTGLAAGAYTYYAIATDTTNLTSAVSSATLTVGNVVTTGSLLTWNMTGQTAFGTQGLAAGTKAAGITNSLGLTRGAGVVTTGTAAANAWGGTNWQTTSALGISSNATISFALTVAAGNTASLGSIDLNYRRSSTGPANALWQYQINTGAWTNISDITGAFSSTTSTGAAMTKLNLSGVSALQNLAAGTIARIRLVPYGASSTGGTFYIYDMTGNDLVVSGSTATAPAVRAAPVAKFVFSTTSIASVAGDLFNSADPSVGILA